MMSTTFFYIMLFLAAWHFFYESVLAPSLRYELRYKFFTLKDRLSRLQFCGELNKQDKIVYQILNHSICDVIDSTSFLHIGNYILSKKGTNENDYKEVKDFINNAKHEELHNIDKKLSSLGSRALLINHGGWAIYLIVPIVAFLAIMALGIQVFNLKTYLLNIASHLIYSPSKVRKEGLATI